MSSISVRFNNDDRHLKDKIKDLEMSETPGNPYFRRSESEIVKLLLLNGILVSEHKKWTSGE
jgi:hypothetical protein